MKEKKNRITLMRFFSARAKIIVKFILVMLKKHSNTAFIIIS